MSNEGNVFLQGIEGFASKMNEKGDPTPAPAADTPIPAPNGDEPTPAPANANEPTPAAPTPTPDADEPTFKLSDLKSVFGDDVDGIETIKTRWSEVSQTKTKAAEYENKIKEFEQILPTIENPIKSAKAAKIEAFYDKTGIDDDKVVAFVGKQADDLKKSPVDMLVLNEVINNPSLLNGNSFDDLKAMMAARHGVTTDVTLEDIPDSMKWDINTIANTLQEKLNVAPKEFNVFSTKQKEVQAQREQFEQLKSQAQPIIAAATNKLTHIELTTEGGVPIKIEVPQETKVQMLNTLDAFYAQQGYQGISTKTLEEQLPKVALSFLSPLDVMKATEKAISAEAQKKALDSIHNPTPVVRTDAAPKPSSGKSEVREWLDKALG